VLVRADLLIAPAHLLSTSFQMEYLPSGARCTGRVTSIDDDGLGFRADCRLRSGAVRHVSARWGDSPGGQLTDGTVSSSE
jgi:hypothetical protein